MCRLINIFLLLDFHYVSILLIYNINLFFTFQKRLLSFRLHSKSLWWDSFHGKLEGHIQLSSLFCVTFVDPRIEDLKVQKTSRDTMKWQKDMTLTLCLYVPSRNLLFVNSLSLYSGYYGTWNMLLSEFGAFFTR